MVAVPALAACARPVVPLMVAELELEVQASTVPEGSGEVELSLFRITAVY
jgi:hypothetical protein